MFKNMKLSAKLVSLFLLAGIVPAAIIGMIALTTASKDMKDQKKVTFGTLTAVREIKKGQIEQYFAEREGDMGVLVETVGTLRQEAMSKLEAVREVKKAATQRYFQTIEDQIITFSQDQMVVDAMRQFKDSFAKVREESAIDSDQLAKMRNDLFTYYSGDFSNEYRNQNSGKSPGIDRLFKPLDDDSVVLQYKYIKANAHPLGSKHLLDSADDNSRYSLVHGKVHPIIRNYLDKFGYYDIFLVDSDTGDII